MLRAFAAIALAAALVPAIVLGQEIIPPPLASPDQLSQSGRPIDLPSQPVQNVRPPEWPGGRPSGPPPTLASAVDQNAVPLEGTEILARVGSEVILAADVAPQVNEIMAAALQTVHIPPDQIEGQRRLLTRQRLQKLIEDKVVVNEARSKVPKEALAGIEKRIGDHFDKEQVPKQMKKLGIETRAQYDAKLHEMGSSLEHEKRSFVEGTLAWQWLQEQLKLDEKNPPVVSPVELLSYYREHSAEFDIQGRARWEQLMVRFDHFSSKAEAYSAIAALGNQVLGGAPLAELAKARSDGPTAAVGGYYDWTTQGSLVSQKLDEAIFKLPVGQLSPILEDERGFHIVRVLERRDANRKAFADVQREITEKIRAEKIARQKREYVARIVAETPVWTAFDGTGTGWLTERTRDSLLR